MRNRVSILLSFAVRRDYRASNPCARLEQVTPPAKTPQILTPQELEICSRWFASNPRALGWFARSARMPGDWYDGVGFRSVLPPGQ